MKELDRLLRAAAETKDDAPIEAPFGFDTRVIALWRASGNGGFRGLTRLIRRVALAAVAVIIVATAGAYLEINQTRDGSESFGNEFAIADSAIQEEFPQ
jgi:hypothetical protein